MAIRITDVGYGKLRTDVSYVDTLVDELYYVIAKVQTASYVDASIQGVSYVDASIQGLSYVDAAAQDLTYVDLQVQNLFVDPDTKNRVVRDITTLVETFILDMDKTFDEYASVEDSPAVLIGKTAADIIGVADTYVKGFTKHLVENLPTLDTVTAVLTKVLHDAVQVLEVRSIASTKPMSEAIAVADTFVKTMIFSRHFADSIAIQSDSVLAVTKSQYDSYNIADILDIVAELHKLDSVSTNDICIVVRSKLLQNSVAVQSANRISTAKVVADASVVQDFSHITSEKGVSDNIINTDAVTLSAIFKHTETINTISTNAILVNSYKTDSVLSADSIAINYSAAYYDYVLTSDFVEVFQTRGIVDTTTTSDLITSISTYKKLYDGVTTDDDFKALNFVDKIKNNTATPTDSTTVTSSKGVFDSVFTTDIDTLSVNKYTNDVIGNITEVVAINGFKYLTDSVIITDNSAVDMTVYDRFNNSSAVFDTQNIVLLKGADDSTTATDRTYIGAVKNITENVSAQDYVSIQLSAGASSLFNELMFNNSTFG